jgi:uncharacterized Zn finger protein (UPF0148 family)
MVSHATILRHRCPVCSFVMVVRCGRLICTNAQCTGETPESKTAA